MTDDEWLKHLRDLRELKREIDAIPLDEFIEEFRRGNFHHVNDTDPDFAKPWSVAWCARVDDLLCELIRERARSKVLLEAAKKWAYVQGKHADKARVELWKAVEVYESNTPP